MTNISIPTSAVTPPSRQNPNGELDGRQLRFLGDAIAPYGEAGCADITTRAAIQLRGIPLDGADKIITGLWDVGMTSLQTGRSIVELSGPCTESWYLAFKADLVLCTHISTALPGDFTCLKNVFSAYRHGQRAQPHRQSHCRSGSA